MDFLYLEPLGIVYAKRLTMFFQTTNSPRPLHMQNMKLPIEEDGFWHGVLVDPHPYITHRRLTPRYRLSPLGWLAFQLILSSRDCFLLLGCDGVWENWSHQVRTRLSFMLTTGYVGVHIADVSPPFKECVDFIFEKLDDGVSVDELTEAITRRALEKGSLDNISATLILFKWE